MPIENIKTLSKSLNSLPDRELTEVLRQVLEPCLRFRSMNIRSLIGRQHCSMPLAEDMPFRGKCFVGSSKTHDIDCMLLIVFSR